MRTALAAKHLSKRFGSNLAVDDVDISLRFGEVHAIVGANGAGKTTLVRLLCGELEPNEGTIEIESTTSIGMVHQHFMLAQTMTVGENLALASKEPGWLLNVPQAATPAIALSSSLGWPIDLQARVDSLSVGAQQRLEILKVLSREPQIVILDEPTAVLSEGEIDNLFTVLRSLADSGKSVVLIAHKLAEVVRAADRISVLRSGRVVDRAEKGSFDAASLAHAMVGEIPQHKRGIPSEVGDVVASCAGLTVHGDRAELRVDAIDLVVRAGEIVGLGGVDGNGQVELAEALAGVRPFKGSLSIPDSTAYLPQDRHRDGVVLNMSLVDNLAYTDCDSGFIRNSVNEQGKAERLVDEYGIRTTSIHEPLRALSGGNQQKVLVARTLDKNPSFVVAVNPTRGLDIAASMVVRDRLREAASAGGGILLVSTDQEELTEACDEIHMMHKGKLYSKDEYTYVLGGLE